MAHKCFISAPFGANISKIVNHLKRKGLKVINPIDVSEPGFALTDKLSKLISSSDFIIAVLPEEISSPSVYFELGCAFGLGKKILLVTSNPSIVPFVIQDFCQVILTDDNFESLSFAIDNIISAPKPSTAKKKPVSTKSKPIGNKAKELLERIKKGIEEPTEREIVEVVASAIKQSGISIMSEPLFSDSTRGYRPDIAIWVDELQTHFGNPIIIEIKKDIKNKKQAGEIIKRVSKYQKVSNSQTALVLYYSGISSNAPYLFQKLPRIYFFKIDEFIKELENKNLGKIMINKRNRVAHGAYGK